MTYAVRKQHRTQIMLLFGDESDGADGAENEDDMMMDDFGMAPEFGPEELFFVSDKGRLFVASSVPALDMLLARVDGDRTKSIG